MRGRKDSEQEDGLNSVHLTLDILEYLVNEGGDRGVTEIAHHLKSSKARIFRYLQTLRERGYVIQDNATEKYGIGIRLFILGQSLNRKFDLVGAVRPELEKLWEATGQTVAVASLYQDNIVILDVIRGRTPIEIGLRVGTTFELHATAQGRVLLAFGPPELRTRVLSKPLRRLTPNTTTDPKRLEEDLREIRMRGWASTPDELTVGMNALAAPVFDHNGHVAGTVAITGLTQFIPARPSEELIDALTTCAWNASRNLGWRGDIRR